MGKNTQKGNCTETWYGKDCINNEVTAGVYFYKFEIVGNKNILV